MSADRAHDPPPHEGIAAPGVTLLRWPEDEPVRVALARAGLPRILVIPADAPPPLVWDDAEDWLREDADPAEVATRTARLARISPERTPRRRALLDLDGVLHIDGAIVVVPPIEAALLARLLDRQGQVVRRAELHRVGWPDGRTDERAVDSRVRTLRRRIAATPLTIHTIRGVGYLLEEID